MPLVSAITITNTYSTLLSPFEIDPPDWYSHLPSITSPEISLRFPKLPQRRCLLHYAYTTKCTTTCTSTYSLFLFPVSFSLASITLSSLYLRLILIIYFTFSSFKQPRVGVSLQRSSPQPRTIRPFANIITALLCPSLTIYYHPHTKLRSPHIISPRALKIFP